jgi:hypothetical protein
MVCPHLSVKLFHCDPCQQTLVGNTVIPDYVDLKLPTLLEIPNTNDSFPILPDPSLGFSYLSGEIHIRDNIITVSCGLVGNLHVFSVLWQARRTRRWTARPGGW